MVAQAGDAAAEAVLGPCWGAQTYVTRFPLAACLPPQARRELEMAHQHDTPGPESVQLPQPQLFQSSHDSTDRSLQRSAVEAGLGGVASFPLTSDTEVTVTSGSSTAHLNKVELPLVSFIHSRPLDSYLGDASAASDADSTPVTVLPSTASDHIRTDALRGMRITRQTTAEGKTFAAASGSPQQTLVRHALSLSLVTRCVPVFCVFAEAAAGERAASTGRCGTWRAGLASYHSSGSGG